MSTPGNIPYTTSELFHFVGRKSPKDDEANYLTLKRILTDGCISCPPHIPGWGQIRIKYDPSRTLLDGKLLVADMVCFCDIPTSSLGIHVSKYSPFGLSIKRDHLVKYGARPIIYFPTHAENRESIYGTTALKDITAAYQSLESYSEPLRQQEETTRIYGEASKTLEDLLQALDSVLLLQFLAFIKPFDSTLPISHPDNYYMEREWRKLGNVDFNYEHVGMIVVPQAFVERLKADVPLYAKKVQDISSFL